MAVCSFAHLRSMRPTGIDPWPTVWIISLECFSAASARAESAKNPHSKRECHIPGLAQGAALFEYKQGREASPVAHGAGNAQGLGFIKGGQAPGAFFAAHWSSGAADLPRRQIMALPRMALPRGCYFLSTQKKANSPPATGKATNAGHLVAVCRSFCRLHKAGRAWSLPGRAAGILHFFTDFAIPPVNRRGPGKY